MNKTLIVIFVASIFLIMSLFFYTCSLIYSLPSYMDYEESKTLILSPYYLTESNSIEKEIDANGGEIIITTPIDSLMVDDNDIIGYTSTSYFLIHENKLTWLKSIDLKLLSIKDWKTNNDYDEISYLKYSSF